MLEDLPDRDFGEALVQGSRTGSSLLAQSSLPLPVEVLVERRDHVLAVEGPPTGVSAGPARAGRQGPHPSRPSVPIKEPLPAQHWDRRAIARDDSRSFRRGSTCGVGISLDGRRVPLPVILRSFGEVVQGEYDEGRWSIPVGQDRLAGLASRPSLGGIPRGLCAGRASQASRR